MPDRPTPFILLASERTGSTLLTRMLHSHPEIFAGEEIFNEGQIKKNHIPWFLDDVPRDPELLRLRRDDPVAFLNRLFELTTKQGFRAIGFKLMYYHADHNEIARDYLASDTNIRVIHIKRRNLLRRYLSNERARVTNTWIRTVGTDEKPPPPPVRLDFMNCMRDFASIERKQAEYAERFKDHEVLDVTYEDMAEDPRAEGARAVAFLGATPTTDLQVLEKKSSSDSLRDAIPNYDELKTHIRRWASFFED